MPSLPPDPPSGHPTGPPPKEEPGKAPEAETTNTRPTKPPTRRQTMELQVAWLETKPTIEHITTPAASDIVSLPPDSLPPVEQGPTQPPVTAGEPAPDADAEVSSRLRPPRLPGSLHTLPPIPSVEAAPTKPPPPVTADVEMSWVEIVDEELTEEDLPDDVYDAIVREQTGPPPEVVRDMTGPPPDVAPELEGPTIDEALLLERAAAADEAFSEKMREDALAQRKREQDARDREIRQRRKIERERERLEQEAKTARREQDKSEETARVEALRQGRPANQVLDLSGIDDEIDFALESILGPNLSYVPPPRSSDTDPEEKK